MLIPLSRGLYATISEQDAELVCAHKWHVHPIQRKTGGFYAAGCIDGKTAYLHRLIMGAAKGQQVDHINGDGLDNRRENLRLCSAHQNCANIPSKREHEGMRGIYLRKKTGMFNVQLWAGGKYFGFGNFKTLDEARRVRDEAALRLHGEFARLNTGVAA